MNKKSYLNFSHPTQRPANTGVRLSSFRKTAPVALSLLLCLSLSACSVLNTGGAKTSTGSESTSSPQDKGKQVGKSEQSAEYPDAPIRPIPSDAVFPLLVAEFATRRNQLDLAMQKYQSLAASTQDVGILETAAKLAQFLNDDKLSLELTEQWLALEPNNPEANYIAAASLAKRGQIRQAMSRMEIVLDQGMQANFAVIAANALNLSENKQLEFLQELVRLRSKHPKENSLKTAEALTLQYRKQPEKALKLIREVLAQQPADMHALLVELQCLDRLKRSDELLERLQFAVANYPQDKRLRMQLARALAHTDVSKSVEQYVILSQLYPDDEGITLALALLSRETGDQETAKAQLKRLINSDIHGSRARYFLARIAEQDLEFMAAITLFQQVPPGQEFLVANSRLATLAQQQLGIDEARAIFDSQRKRYSKEEISLYIIEAEMLQRSHRYKEGHKLLSTAIRQYPNNTELLYSRSLFSAELQNVPLLEQDLRIILESEPDNAAALNALGYSLATLTDRLDEARDLVEKALDINPTDPAIMDSMGWVAYRQGDLPLARKHLEAAFDKSKDHEIAAHLGEVLWVMGLKTEAKGVWQEGLEKNPDSKHITDTIKRLTD